MDVSRVIVIVVGYDGWTVGLTVRLGMTGVAGEEGGDDGRVEPLSVFVT